MKFILNATDYLNMIQIAIRVEENFERHDLPFDRMEFLTDLAAVHQNGVPLDFKRLLSSDNFNFSRDTLGIMHNLDRATGKLQCGFLPRCVSMASDVTCIAMDPIGYAQALLKVKTLGGWRDRNPFSFRFPYHQALAEFEAWLANYRAGKGPTCTI